MTTANEARVYLAQFLAQRQIEMKAASLSIGRNHAYLHQYITKGKPAWLREPEREGLAARYGLDPERLRPPPAGSRLQSPSADSRHQRQAHPPGYGKFVDDPRTLDLLDIWDTVPADQRDLALRVLRNFATDSVSVVA